MLDKVSKKLLVSLQEHFESQTDYIPLDYDEIISLSGLSERDVISALDYLEYKGLVEICYYADSNIEYGAARLHIMVCITGNSTVWSAMPVGENASTAFYLVLL